MNATKSNIFRAANADAKSIDRIVASIEGKEKREGIPPGGDPC